MHSDSMSVALNRASNENAPYHTAVSALHLSTTFLQLSRQAHNFGKTLMNVIYLS